MSRPCDCDCHGSKATLCDDGLALPCCAEGASLAVARWVRSHRSANTSWRRLAELSVGAFPGLDAAMGWPPGVAADGNQLFGKDLCRAAGHALGEEDPDWDY